jgi:hypothetical protein
LFLVSDPFHPASSCSHQRTGSCSYIGSRPQARFRQLTSSPVVTSHRSTRGPSRTPSRQLAMPTVRPTGLPPSGRPLRRVAFCLLGSKVMARCWMFPSVFERMAGRGCMPDK